MLYPSTKIIIIPTTIIDEKGGFLLDFLEHTHTHSPTHTHAHTHPHTKLEQHVSCPVGMYEANRNNIQPPSTHTHTQKERRKKKRKTWELVIRARLMLLGFLPVLRLSGSR